MNEYLAKLDKLVDTVEDMGRLPEQPLVSVWMITYNHEKFIAQALDGILMQEVDFPYEIVLGEDYSTDRTREIVCDYQRRHPDKIRLRLSRENLWSHKLKNSIGVLSACRGKYIALCEGDDYWTDPKKLQKQVDILEAHPECSACFTNAAVENENGDEQPSVYLGSGRPESLGLRPRRDYLSQIDLIWAWCVPTCTMVMRHEHVKVLPGWLSQIPAGDWGLGMILSERGPFKYLDINTATYRRHQGGVWTGRSAAQQWALLVQLWKTYLPFAPPEASRMLREHLTEGLDHLRRHAIGDMTVQLETGRRAQGQLARQELLAFFGRNGYRGICMDAWERYFQSAYFKGDLQGSRRRLAGLLARHPEWLFRRGSLGQIVRTMRGF